MSTDHTTPGSQPLPEAGGRLRCGDVVHVKPGSRHPMYADLPMGGWSGTVERIQKHKTDRRRRCWVCFFDSTTERLHPVYEDRERRDNGDDCELWDNWLPEEQLERGEVPPDAIEQPVLPPWFEKAGDRQVRALFGLGPDDPYPDCAPKTWRVWHRFLTEHIPLPRLLAEDDDEDDDFYGERLILQRLLLPDELPDDYPDDEDRHGVYGELAVEGDEALVLPLDEILLPEDDPYDNLLRDYDHWYDAIHDSLDADDDDFDDIPFGMTRSQFKPSWNAAKKSAFRPDAGIPLPDETDLESAMSLLDRRSQPIVEEPPDFDAPPEPIRAAPRV
ncbi:MAG TPA: hypothetical protein PK867_30375, partial [Pirellulales bacterium]|nr:hypothetical protein [Pirellulales bacterium]